MFCQSPCSDDYHLINLTDVVKTFMPLCFEWPVAAKLLLHASTNFDNIKYSMFQPHFGNVGIASVASLNADGNQDEAAALLLWPHPCIQPTTAACAFWAGDLGGTLHIMAWFLESVAVICEALL